MLSTGPGQTLREHCLCNVICKMLDVFNSPLIWTTTPHTLSVALIAKREASVVPVWWSSCYLGSLYAGKKSCIGGRLFIELYRVLDVYLCLCFYTGPRAQMLIMI